MTCDAWRHSCSHCVGARVFTPWRVCMVFIPCDVVSKVEARWLILFWSCPVESHVRVLGRVWKRGPELSGLFHIYSTNADSLRVQRVRCILLLSAVRA